jgi:PAS domain S-box-containing protein
MESKKKKILIIDDNKDNHVVLKALLNESFPDISILSALSGAVGLELAASDDPDVILLDIIMPGMDGFEVCQRLKNDKNLGDIPVVFVTSLMGEKETRIRALEVGAEAFLTKPVDEIELTAQIRAMLKIKAANLEKRDEKRKLVSVVEEQLLEIKSTQIATLNMLEDVTRENEARKKSEEALSKSEEKYRTIFENVQDVFYQTNLEGAIIDISPSIFYFSQYTREELIGAPVFTLYFNRSDRQNLINTIFKNGELRDYELKFKKKNGEINYVSINARLIYDANGKPTHIDGAIRDIHFRKLAGNRMDISSRILNSLNTSSILSHTIKLTIDLIQNETGCDAIGIRLKNGTDFPFYIQSGFSDDFLRTENTLLGKTEAGTVCLDNNGNPCLECTCGLVISDQKNTSNPLFTEGGSFFTNYSPVLLDLTGSDEPRHHPRNLCIHEGFLSFALIPIRAKGEIVGLMQLNDRKKDCFTTDMIQFLESIGEIIGVAVMRRHAEEALERSHKLLFNLSEQVPGVIYQYRLYPDGHSCFPYSSSGMNEIYEVTPEEVREDATAVFGMIHPDDHSRVSELIYESARTLKHFDCEYRVILPRQGLRWRYSDALPQRMEDNSTLWHGIIYDITARKEVEKELLELNNDLDKRVNQRTAELEAANKDLEAFSYSVSHDLKAPLRHINGFIGLFLENKTTEFTEEELGYLKKITDAAGEMAHLIDALLSFSRLNLAELHKARINTPEMVRQVINFFEPEMQNRKITFNLGTLPEIKGDEELMHLVWTNLIANAIKYTSKKPEAVIDIGSMSTDKETTFYIRDNGAGFNMKYASKLFGVFQRLHKSRDFDGVGIGLANVSRIVRRHGGQCRAEGEPDKGATFYFSIPSS